LHEDLSCIFTSILAIKTGHTVLFWVVAFLEGLKSGHEVMATGDTRGDDSFGDTSCDGTFDDSCDRVHRANNFGLELGRDVKFDLLEKIFGGTKATNDKDILQEC